MSFTNGTRLGAFEILDLIGAGGMGEVYRARDTRLERIVAIKVLPRHWADDPAMKQRFEREARTIASLNHPHICTLHDVGREPASGSGPAVDFLVMEYLEGETLAQRLERGALDMNEALRVAVDLADALDKAHRRGVTHRDLKPGNVFLVRGRGSSDPPIAKLLDFGLAKVSGYAGRDSSAESRQDPADGPGPSKLATTPANLTTHGAILGTLQYMAPEQLEGHEADPRTDIFAFGVLVHEMITGRKTFEGKSRVLLMSAIATAELPPLSSIQPASSSALDHLVRMCLAKDPSDRWQTARDLLAELRWIAAGGAGTSTNRPASTAGRRSRLSLALAAGVAALSLVTAAATWLFQGPVEAAASRVHIPTDLPTGGRFNGALPGSAFAVSPDGRMLAFTPGSARPMHVRLIGALAAEPRPGTEGASHPFWSPDSRFVAFVSGGKLMQMEAKGGPPRPICDAPDFAGGDWNADGTIIFGTTKGLFRVPADGGRPPEPLTTTNAQESAHYWPHFLPDGRAFLYLAWSAQPGGHKLFAGSLDSKERTEVMLAESKVAYVEPGYLVFARETALYARRFDANSFSVWGEAERVADGILQGPRGGSSFSVARSGALVYYYIAGGGRAATADNLEWQLSWVDRENGQQVAVAGHFGPYLGAEASPDGSKIAVHKHEGTGGDIFVIEPGATTQLTFDASRDNSSPIWSPHDDGETIVYSSRQNGMWGLYRTRSDGSGSPELLWESELPKAPMSWSPDGKRLVFSVQDPKTMGDVWVLTLDDRKAERLVATQFNETHPQISYDGNWMAYTSNRQRGRNEIFVQPFPKGEGILYVISRDGGDWPRWKRDGTELFFHALISGAVNPGAILAAPVDGTRPAFGHWDPREVLVTLAVDLPHPAGGYSTYGVSPDGKQFLVPQQVVRSDPATGTGQTSAADPAFGLVAALNWTTALRK